MRQCHSGPICTGDCEELQEIKILDTFAHRNPARPMTSIFSSLIKSGEIAQRITCLTFPASKQGSELLFPFEQEVWIIATAAKVSSRKHFISLFISQPSFPYEDNNHGRKSQKESFRNELTDQRSKSMRHRGDVYRISTENQVSSLRIAQEGFEYPSIDNARMKQN